MRRALAAGLLFALTATGPAQAQPESVRPLWGRLSVPGTPAALAHAVGLDARATSLTPEWVLFEVVRAAHGEPDAPSRRSLNAYLDLLERFESARAGAGPAMSLAAAAEREGRSRLEAFLRVAGLTMVNRDGHVSVARRTDEASVDQRALLLSAGAAIEGLEDRLNAGDAVDPDSVRLPSFVAPLPMYEAWWAVMLRPGEDLFRTIATDRRAAFLYYGLSSLDAPTRAHLVEAPALTEVFLEHAPVFAAYGGSLRVRNARIDVPGGDEAVAWWERLVGAPVTDPGRFASRVLSRDSGRLAYFYALLDALGPSRARFAIGLSTPPPTRPDDVFAWFNRDEVGFEPTRRPFSKPSGDPMLLLAQVAVDADGRPSGPAWPYLWNAVFAGPEIPDAPERELRPSAALADAPFWFDAVHGPGLTDPRVRLNTLLFAQRVFAGAPEDAAPDLLRTLRGFQRFPLLCLTLERMGVRSPAAYAAAVGLADDLSAITTPRQAFASLSQFQGVIALLEIATRTRRMTPERAAELVGSLAGVPLDRQGSFGGDIARWIDVELLPTISTAPPSGPSSLERAFLAGLSGLSAVPDPADLSGAGPVFEWQGWQYRVDPSRALFERVRAIRARQAGNSLDAVLRLSRITATLSGDIALDSVAAQSQALAAVADDLREPHLPLAIPGSRPLRMHDEIRTAVQELSRITDARRLRDVTRVAIRLHALTAELTADVLRALTYAVSIPDPQTVLLADGDLSHQHDLGVDARTVFERDGVAWGVPERQGGPVASVRARGSLLGLDLALADLALDQASADGPPALSSWSFEDLRAWVQVLALFSPFDARLGELPVVADAIREGRRRLASATAGEPGLNEALTAAGVSPLRRGIAEWALLEGTGPAAAMISMAELVRFGGGSEAARAAAPWGASGLVLNGCLCLTLDPVLPWDFLAARGGAWGYLGARVPDLSLRIAETLAARGVLPAAAADVLPQGVQTVIEQSRLSHVDDWIAAVRDAALETSAIEGFISSATTGGSIVPSSGVLP